MNRWWKGLVIILLIVSLAHTWMQLAQVQRFVGKGPRFTAADGQQLCERVAQLERYSYGYRDAGKAPLACDYVERK